MAGATNDYQRMEVIDCLQNSTHSNFIILFKNTGRQTFQGLYAFDSEGEVTRIFGNEKLPFLLTDNQIATYYKYSSGSKVFNPIQGNRALSIAVDAVELKQLPTRR